MLKVEYRSLFSGMLLLAWVLTVGCNSPQTPSPDGGVSFAVIDVGQGLSQIVVAGDEAVVFDVGPADAEARWLAAYNSLGRPQIKAIVISHRDADHSGGLAWIDGALEWSGLLIASCREDTSLLRARCTRWKQPVVISTVAMGDTIPFIKGCPLACIWPPPTGRIGTVPVSDDSTNYYSIVCHLQYQNNTALITGDIDSTGAREIAVRYAQELQSDIVVVPHHGSAGSVCPLFYGYLRSAWAVLSFGAQNSYGHPSELLLNTLAEQGIRTITTPEKGAIVWRSNGYYWSSLF